MQPKSPGRIKFAVLLGWALVVFQLVHSGCKNKLASQQLTSEQRQLAVELKDLSKSYLVAKLGVTSFGGKAFCAYKVLDIELKGEDLNEYVHAVCQEYYLKGGELTEGTGWRLPVALVLRKDGLAYKVIGHKAPRDSGYSRDVEQIFPKNTHEEIYEDGYTSWKHEVESEAKNYFGK